MNRSEQSSKPQPTYAQQASQKNKKPAAYPTNSTPSQQKTDISVPPNGKIPSTTTVSQAHNLSMNGSVPASGKKQQTAVSIPKSAFKSVQSSATIQFGSINQPNQPAAESSPSVTPAQATGIQSGGGAQSISNVLQFGTFPSPNAPITRPHLMDIPRTHSAPPQFSSQTPDNMNTHFTQATTAAPVAAPHRPTTHDFGTPGGHIATSESSAGSANTSIHMHSTPHPIPQPPPSSLPVHNQSHPHQHYMPQNFSTPMNFYPPQPHHRNNPPHHKQPAGANQQYAGIPAAYHYSAQPPRGPREGKMVPPMQPSQPGSMPPQQAPYSTSPNTQPAYPYITQPIGGGYPSLQFNPFPQQMPPQMRTSMSLKSTGDIKIPPRTPIKIVNPNTNQVVDFTKELPASTTLFPTPAVTTSTPIATTITTPSVLPVSTPSPRVSHAVPIVNPKEMKPVQVEPTKTNEIVPPKPGSSIAAPEPSQAKTIASSTMKVADVTSAIESPKKTSETVEGSKADATTDVPPEVSANDQTAPLVAKPEEAETKIELPEVVAKDESSVPASASEESTETTIDSGAHDVLLDESESNTVAVSEEGDTTADADELEEGEILEEAETKHDEIAETETEMPDVKMKRVPPHGIDLSRSVSAPSMATGSPRNMDSLEGIRYPAEITPTTPTVDGKLKYDRDFLLQFMDLCRDKPSNLQEMKTDQPNVQGGQPQRKGPGMPGRHDPSSSKPAAFAMGGAMGQFGFSKNVPKSSSQRFEESNRNLPPRMNRSSSGSSLMPPMMSSNMMGIPPRPDGRRGQSSRGGRDDRRGGGRQGGPQPTGLTIPLDQIVPLQMSESRWVARPTAQTADGRLAPEAVEKKVKGLLNKLTLEKFESISAQIIAIANQSENEKNGFSLKSVIRFIFEKATDEPGFSGMYAQLCKAMMERLSDKIVDDDAIAKDGKPITGGLLFRKCLLNRCQEDFEKGWKVEDGEAPPATSSAPGEEILTEEYYAAQKKKRRGLGLIQFIGELFKGGMLKENIMHGCIRRLLANVESPEEEETESLCKLMTTIGRQIDHERAEHYVNTYMERMAVLSKNEELPSRIRYMVQDVIDLRKDKWVARRAVAAPKTIAQIHQDAAKAKLEAAHAEVLRRSASSGSRGMPNLSQQLAGSRRGPKASNMDGWSTVPQKATTVDLEAFGKISKNKGQSGQVPLGPGASPFGGGSKGWQNEKKTSEDKTLAMSRTSSQNKFSALEAVSTRRPSVDDSQPSPSDRPPRLNLLPKGSTVTETPVAEPSVETTETSDDATKTPEEVRTTIASLMKEFWNVRDVTIAAVIIREDIADPEYHVEIIEQFVLNALEKKLEDVKAVSQLLEGLQDTISADHFREAFASVNEQVDDIAIDAPQAPRYFGQMFASTGLPVSDLEEITKDLSPTLITKILESART